MIRVHSPEITGNYDGGVEIRCSCDRFWPDTEADNLKDAHAIYNTHLAEQYHPQAA